MTVKYEQIKAGLDLELRRLTNLKETAEFDREKARLMHERTKGDFCSGQVFAYGQAIKSIEGLLVIFEMMEFSQIAVTAEPIPKKGGKTNA